MVIDIMGDNGAHKGTLSFDGRVLEFFGFGHPESQRLHVHQISRIEAGRKGNKLVFTVNYDRGYRTAFFDSPREGELKEIVSKIREKI